MSLDNGSSDFEGLVDQKLSTVEDAFTHEDNSEGLPNWLVEDIVSFSKLKQNSDFIAYLRLHDSKAFREWEQNSLDSKALFRKVQAGKFLPMEAYANWSKESTRVGPKSGDDKIANILRYMKTSDVNDPAVIARKERVNAYLNKMKNSKIKKNINTFEKKTIKNLHTDYTIMEQDEKSINSKASQASTKSVNHQQQTSVSKEIHQNKLRINQTLLTCICAQVFLSNVKKILKWKKIHLNSHVKKIQRKARQYLKNKRSLRYLLIRHLPLRYIIKLKVSSKIKYLKTLKWFLEKKKTRRSKK